MTFQNMDKMFLITTADQRFWKFDKPILFLGEWCKLFSEKTKWSELDYKVLPYHWDECEKLYDDHLYLNNLYEEILLELSPNLNKIHGVDHSVRYWRTIVGLWLFGFIFVLYDRYKSILSAAESGKVENVFIIRSDKIKYVPQDFAAFSFWATQNDEYNLFLYSRIIEDLERIQFEYIESENQDIMNIDSVDNDRKSLSFLLKKNVRRFLQMVPQIFNKIILVETGLSVKDIIRLQLSLNQIPFFVSPKRVTLKTKINRGLREEIHLRSSNDKFQKLLMQMITEQIPTLYVEGYAKFNRISLKAYPKCSKIAFNAVAFNANEPFKFWAGYHIDRGLKLLGCQHGGLWRSGSLSSIENHQIKICDTCYTWGWESDSYDNTKPIAAARLNTIKSKIRPKKDGRLLLVENAITRYSFVPELLCISSSGYLAYLKEQFRFVSALSAKNQKLLLVRLYVHDYQFSQKDRWKSKFHEIESSDANGPIVEQINMSRLIIGTTNATTYLETFVANFPTVLFWNKGHGKLRALAQPYFDGIRRVGILHDTPEQAADKVNEIAEDPISWWKQPDIQEAKDKYCFKFARTSDKWVEEWKCELRKQMGG